MGTADPMGVDVVTVGPTAPALIRAAVALRWNRPDLTATLAELALESATDVESWVVAAGWLLHGRAALGHGRQVTDQPPSGGVRAPVRAGTRAGPHALRDGHRRR